MTRPTPIRAPSSRRTIASQAGGHGTPRIPSGHQGVPHHAEQGRRARACVPVLLREHRRAGLDPRGGHRPAALRPAVDGSLGADGCGVRRARHGGLRGLRPRERRRLRDAARPRALRSPGARRRDGRRSRGGPPRLDRRRAARRRGRDRPGGDAALARGRQLPRPVLAHRRRARLLLRRRHLRPVRLDQPGHRHRRRQALDASRRPTTTTSSPSTSLSSTTCRSCRHTTGALLSPS